MLLVLGVGLVVVTGRIVVATSIATTAAAATSAVVVVVASTVSTATSILTSASSASLRLLASGVAVMLVLEALSSLALIKSWMFLYQPLIDLEAKVATFR